MSFWTRRYHQSCRTHVYLLASAHVAAALPCLLPNAPSLNQDSQGQPAAGPAHPDAWKPGGGERSRVPATEVRPLVLMDPDGPEPVLPILVPWWLPKLCGMGANEVAGSACTWTEDTVPGGT